MNEWLFEAWMIQAWSWTLLHFLWQGLIVVGAAATGLVFLRKKSPSMRYVWSVSCLLFMLLCPLATFVSIQQYPHLRTIAHFDPAATLIDSAEAALPFQEHALPKTVIPVLDRSVQPPNDTVRPVHIVVVGVWLIGQLMGGLRIWLSLLCVHRYRKLSRAVEHEVLVRVRALADRLRIQCPQIATSTLIHGAMAAGFLRRTVLLPASWLTEMPPQMLDAIIAHELAHLKRHDLWVNLLQRIMETLLFFHPAVWWLSCRIRHERELCCDQLAVRVTRQRQLYAETLEQVARRAILGSYVVATQVGDDRMSVLRRVRFVLGDHVSKSSGWWPAGMLALAIPFGLIWSGYPVKTLAEQPQEGSAEAVEPTAGHTPVEQHVTAPDVVEIAPRDGVISESGAKIGKFGARASAEWKLGDYVIEPPDVLLLKCEGISDQLKPLLDEHLLVQPDGTVKLGDLGSVHVAGMTINDARRAIDRQLSKHVEHPIVSLDVAINSKCVYVVQEDKYGFHSVLRVPVTGKETVIDVIMQIDGVNQLSKKSITLIRPQPDGVGVEKRLPVEWRGIVERGESATNYQVLPGDRIIIVNRLNRPTGPKQPPPPAVDATPPDDPSSCDRARSPSFSVGVPADAPAGAVDSFQHRIPIMGPVTSGGPPITLDPPTDRQILRIIRMGSFASALHEDKLKIEKQLIAEYADPPKNYPLIGLAQLHHSHYKCVVFESQNSQDGGQTLYVDHHHLHIVDKQTAAQWPASDVCEASTEKVDHEKTSPKSELFSTVYSVGDLIQPLGPPEFSQTGKRVHVAQPELDFDTLIELIKSTIAPDTWDSRGGPGTLAPFESNQSIVVTQRQDIQEEIVKLFDQLRRTRELRFAINATTFALPKSMLARVGLHEKRIAQLTAEEKKQIIAATAANPAARAYAGTRALLMNGEIMVLPIPATNGSDADELRLQCVLNGGKPRFHYGLVSEEVGWNVDELTLLVASKPHNGSSDESKRWFRMIEAELLPDPAPVLAPPR